MKNEAEKETSLKATLSLSQEGAEKLGRDLAKGALGYLATCVLIVIELISDYRGSNTEKDYARCATSHQQMWTTAGASEILNVHTSASVIKQPTTSSR